MEPWDQKRIAEHVEALLAFLDGLGDAEIDAIVANVLPKLQQRSGLDVFAFRAAVKAVLSSHRH